MLFRYRKGVGGITGWYYQNEIGTFTGVWNYKGGNHTKYKYINAHTQEEIEKTLEAKTENSIWDDPAFDIKEYITMQALSIAYAMLDNLGPTTLKEIERELFEVMKRLKIYDDTITTMRATCQ